MECTNASPDNEFINVKSNLTLTRMLGNDVQPLLHGPKGCSTFITQNIIQISNTKKSITGLILCIIQQVHENTSKRLKISILVQNHLKHYSHTRVECLNASSDYGFIHVNSNVIVTRMLINDFLSLSVSVCLCLSKSVCPCLSLYVSLSVKDTHTHTHNHTLKHTHTHTHTHTYTNILAVSSTHVHAYTRMNS